MRLAEGVARLFDETGGGRFAEVPILPETSHVVEEGKRKGVSIRVLDEEEALGATPAFCVDLACHLLQEAAILEKTMSLFSAGGFLVRLDAGERRGMTTVVVRVALRDEVPAAGPEPDARKRRASRANGR